MAQKKLCFFKVPDQQSREKAVGSMAGLPIKVKKALQAIKKFGQPIDEPGPNDWLNCQDEDGQTFESYKSSNFNTISEKKNTICIQPLEPTVDSEYLKSLHEFLSVFYFGVNVVILKGVNIAQVKEVDTRINEFTNKPQYNAKNILNYLKHRVPANAYCVIGVLLTDLYPQDEWNFVFGIASIFERIGVFSFARYDQAFFTDNLSDKTPKALSIYQACRVAAHEIGHMFGIRHCIFYSCLMNGSMHAQESDKKPTQLCPCCVHKLQFNLGFPFLQRYQALAQYCLQAGEYWQKDYETYQKLTNAVKEAYGPHYKEENEQNDKQHLKK